MRTIAVLGVIGAALIAAGVTGKAYAADLDPTDYPPPPVAAEPETPVEFGTGWYLRGDVGYADSTRQQLFGDLPTTTSSGDWAGGVGAGYRWNNWFRTDLTANFDGYQDVSAKGSNTNVTCAYQLTGLTDQITGLKDGYSWTPQDGTCSNKERTSLLKTDVMLGGYIDIGTWAGITPYVGAGVGFARIDTWNSLSYVKNSDGTTYQPNLSATGGYPQVWVDANGVALSPQPTNPITHLPVSFAQQNWSQNTHVTKYNFAWSLMGGVAYAVDDHLSLDLGYRYLNLGSYKDASGSSKTIDSQQVKIGVRYAID